MSERKALFFDIDGTILEDGNKIYPSTRKALEQTKKKGYFRFLCTGRTYSMIPEAVLALDFDGIIGGGATYICISDEKIEDRELTLEEVMISLKWLLPKKIGFLYEGRDCIHVMPWSHYENPEEYQRHIKKIGAPYEIIDKAHPEKIHTAKFSCSVSLSQWEYCLKMEEALSPYFHMMVHKKPDSSSIGFVEYLPKGYNKAVGMKKVCDKLHIAKENTYAFGDSNNDLEMLSQAGHSAAMGNGTQKAKEAANYITKEIKEDGLFLAMQHFRLL